VKPINIEHPTFDVYKIVFVFSGLAGLGVSELAPYEILVVCTGNICRSPMAEGLIKDMLPKAVQAQISVSSAGTHAIHGNQASDFAVQVMQSHGVDIAGHRARMLSKPMLKNADLILVMETNHLKYIRFMSFFGMKKAHRISEFDKNCEPYDLPDPIGGDIEQYRATALLLKTCVKGVSEYLEETL
jgi:protein-tyrosine-phosphatase